MKKIIFTAYDLNAGGIERALITLLSNIDYNAFDVTLVLEHNEGTFINEIPNQVHIKEYKINNNKIVLIRKIINRLKLIFTIITNYNKYSFSCCYAPYSIPGSILSRYFSKNNSIWIHSDYYYLYNKDINKIKEFFNDRKISKFNHIIFVSEESKDNFINIYKELENKLVVCNNLVNNLDIDIKSKEKIQEIKPNKTLFLNVARHEEESKKITRLIEACKLLKESKYDFELWLVGNGKDTDNYKELVNSSLLNDNIKFIGEKSNPYPYFKLADAFILTSDYEGFPVVYLESLYFNVPIITTIDNKKLNIKDNYGLIADKNANDIYNKMKYFIDECYVIKNKFDISKFNSEVKHNISNMFNNRWYL